MSFETGSVTEERITSTLNTPIATLHGPVPAMELALRCHNSLYVKHMDDQPYRFDTMFGYEPYAMSEDMGWDVLPRGHQLLTGLHVTWIIEREIQRGTLQLSQEEIGPVVLAALIHDIGESMHPDVKAAVGAVVGDIPAGQKTDENRRAEAAVRRFLYQQVLSDVAPEIIDRIEAIISHQDTSILHEIFEAAHVIQTFDTAMRAGFNWHKHTLLALFGIHTDSDNIRRRTQLQRLHKVVGRHNLPLVQELATQFAYAQDALDYWKEAIRDLEQEKDEENSAMSRLSNIVDDLVILEL